MTMAGEAGPAAFLDVRSIGGLNQSVNRALTTQICALMGENGSGKTTLLRLAAGVERPTSGRILIDNQEVAGPNRFVPPERRGVGLMFQDFALFPHLSVRRNLTYGQWAGGNRPTRGLEEVVGLLGLALVGQYVAQCAVDHGFRRCQVLSLK